jgi:hypothetical protein
MTSDGLRLIQDLRRTLVEPAGRLLPSSAATRRDNNRPGNGADVR